jgi:hypothetical protein
MVTTDINYLIMSVPVSNADRTLVDNYIGHRIIFSQPPICDNRNSMRLDKRQMVIQLKMDLDYLFMTGLSGTFQLNMICSGVGLIVAFEHTRVILVLIRRQHPCGCYGCTIFRGAEHTIRTQPMQHPIEDLCLGI